MDNVFDETGNKIKLMDMRLETFIIAYLSIDYVLHVFNLTIRNFVGNTYKLDTLVIYGVLVFLFVKAFPVMIKRIRAWHILGLSLIISLLLLFMLTSEDRETYLIVFNNIITQCIPMFFCGICIYDHDKVWQGLIRVMTFVPYGYLLMMFFWDLNILRDKEEYSQSEGYTMLLIAVVLASALFEHFSIKYLPPLGISLFYMVAYGARGPIVCWLLYIILKLVVRFDWHNKLKAIGVLTFLSVIAVTVSQFYYEILLGLKILFNQLGLSVRVIDMMLNNSFVQDYGRRYIADICWESIENNPFLGIGPVEDRIYITSRLYSGEEAIGNYPHNIFLEFLMQYGVIVGGILLCIILWLMIKSYRVALNKSAKEIVLILVGTYFFPLFFSGSYLDSRGFYLLIAVCMTIVLNYRKRGKNMYGVRSCENS